VSGISDSGGGVSGERVSEIGKRAKGRIVFSYTDIDAQACTESPCE